MSISIVKDRFTQDGQHSEEDLGQADLRMLERLLTEHLFEWSTTFILRKHPGERGLYVTISRGSLAVMTILEDDEFYDLVGDPTRTGWTSFVHGGQESDHPSRQIVNVAQAVAAAREFVESGTIDVNDPRWEKQREFQNA